MSDDDCIFLDEGGILVSKTRFVSSGQTFALASISSVRGVEVSASHAASIFLLILCVSMVIFGLAAAEGSIRTSVVVCLAGGLLGTAAVMASRSEKPHFVVMLTTAGGETAAYRSPDKDFIERVLGALTEAIISRG